MELAIRGEDIWTTKGAKPRERHETGHLVNGIEVGGSVECGACSVLRVPWGYVSRITFHVSRSGRAIEHHPLSTLALTDASVDTTGRTPFKRTLIV